MVPLVARALAALATAFPTALNNGAKGFGNLQPPCRIRACIEEGLLLGRQGPVLPRLGRRAITGGEEHTSVEQQELQAQTRIYEEEFNFEEADPVLEAPLPLRSDDQWHQVTLVGPPHHCFHNYGDPLCSLNTFLVQRPCHHPGLYQYPTPWADPHTCFCCQDKFVSSTSAQGSVSINVPQIFIPGNMPQVRAMNLDSGGAEMFVQAQSRRTAHLPEECKRVFITYSSDSTSDVVPFVDFLTQHGFQVAVDVCNGPVSRVDSYLKDPSALIIIAISPKYKEDVEGARVDTQSCHTRYIYTMMQNQFIQQGSLNFRFIPVCFLNASQKHVPSWLQNTRVYRWPQEMEDLLLGLLRAEKYALPPVTTDLTVTRRPLAPTSADKP